MITKKELKESLTKANLPITDKDINSIFSQIDLNGDEKINLVNLLLLQSVSKTF